VKIKMQSATSEVVANIAVEDQTAADRATHKAAMIGCLAQHARATALAKEASVEEANANAIVTIAYMTKARTT